MALSDFLNSYTSVSLSSRCSLCSDSVHVAQKNVTCCTKDCCGNKKNYVTPKTDSRRLNMFSVAQKRSTC